MSHIKIIPVLGPESSGKTELSIALAKHYHTCWVPEYAREYLPVLQRNYTADDLLLIAGKQRSMEIECAGQANKILFCDTELINIRQWCIHKFGFSHPWIDSEIKKKPYAFYLLTAPDLPWVPDPLRENPGKGEYFFECYRKEIEYFGFPYAIIDGVNQNRLENAIKAVNQFLDHE